MGYDIPHDILMDNRGKSKAYGRQNLLNAMGEDFPIDLIEAERKVLNEKMFLEEENIVKPGVKELLQWMKEHHILAGVASARVQRVTTEHLEHAGIYDGMELNVTGWYGLETRIRKCWQFALFLEKTKLWMMRFDLFRRQICFRNGRTNMQPMVFGI